MFMGCLLCVKYYYRNWEIIMGEIGWSNCFSKVVILVEKGR